jgi:uncharacterized protein
VNAVQHRALMVLILTIVSTCAVLYYSITHFKINVDMSGMISNKLHFRKLDSDFSKALPSLTDTIVVVIDADTAERAVSIRKGLAERLKQQKELFKSVYEPGGGTFFEKNGLLYLDINELEDFADNMAAAQPLIGFLSRDLSLRGLFSVLGMAVGQSKKEALKDSRIDLLFDQMSKTFDAVAAERPYQLSWQSIMLGEKEANEQRRQFIILQPYLEGDVLSSGEVALKSVWRIDDDLGLRESNGVRVRMTGDVALSHENLAEVKNSIGAATAVSLLLVTVILYIGLGGIGRLILASIATLVIGLIWTTGFALGFVGGLNMISVTFAVLFVGLGIDYSIQFCLRYRELIGSGTVQRDSILTTAKGVGRALFLSCVTTAIGFYSFLPTAYAGVAELGLISGTGMFISFFANLTVLPALLTLFPVKQEKISTVAFTKFFLNVPYTYSRQIVIGALVLGLGAVFLLPMVYFDYNPLNLYNQTSEPIITVKELFKNPEAPPWTASVLVRGTSETRKLAERLSGLKEVKMVVSLFDFVPEHQREKLGIISDTALIMPTNLNDVRVHHLTYEENIKALGGFEDALRKVLLSSTGSGNTSMRRLYESLQKFKAILHNPLKGFMAVEILEKNLLSNLPGLFGRLETSLRASTFGLSDLPRDLVDQYVAVDGRYRIQVFPRENVLDRQALARFVKSVQGVAPDATDAPVTIYESGMAVVSSFQQATLYALVAITIFLLFEMRSFFSTGMVLMPLVLAMLLTGAASVLLHIPLNFANVIVVPLLLGTGVHSGIIFILRYQTEPPQTGNMLQTSTARAILFSSLTTMISTSSLSFSVHRGISSMGIILTICFGFLIIATLILLPALLELSKNLFKKRDIVG